MVISRTFGGSFPVAIPDDTTAQQRKRPTESRVLRDESFLVNFPWSCAGEGPSYCVDRFAKHILKGGCIERQPRVAGRRACAGSPRKPGQIPPASAPRERLFRFASEKWRLAACRRHYHGLLGCTRP